MEKRQSVIFRVTPQDPHAHVFQVICEIPSPTTNGQQFSIPSWIPGSYLIREFAKHVVDISAHSSTGPVALTKIDKQTWCADKCESALTITYSVYAFDPSIRAAYLDQFIGFFNGTSLFIKPHGLENSHFTVSLDLKAHPITQNWEIATTLPTQVNDYDELVDHPFLMGNLSRHAFDVDGIPHSIVLDRPIKADFNRLCNDLEKICRTQIELFDTAAPFSSYMFLVRVEEDGYGGLEHRSCSALLCKPHDFPVVGDTSITDHYRSFLGLCSHEYFHAWNVKRIKPKAFEELTYDQEQYTSLLWIFEGITSYYDDLALVRSGVISQKSYLDLLGKTITRVYQTPGRLKQSLAESSYDTWIKFYRPDENSPNSHISYYTKGSLVALALDLTIRQSTSGKKSLDDIMKALWQRYKETGHGIEEYEFEQLAGEIAGFSLNDFFQTAVRSCDDLPLAELLTAFGIEADFHAEHTTKDPEKPIAYGYLGARYRKSDNQDVVLTHVYGNSPAMRAGLAPHDIIIAIDNARVRSSNIDTTLTRYHPEDKVCIHAFRRGDLFVSYLQMGYEPKWVCTLRLIDPKHPIRDAWLKKEFS